jgi:hypothetical protein
MKCGIVTANTDNRDIHKTLLLIYYFPPENKNID